MMTQSSLDSSEEKEDKNEVHQLPEISQTLLYDV